MTAQGSNTSNGTLLPLIGGGDWRSRRSLTAPTWCCCPLAGAMTTPQPRYPFEFHQALLPFAGAMTTLTLLKVTQETHVLLPLAGAMTTVPRRPA